MQQRPKLQPQNNDCKVTWVVVITGKPSDLFPTEQEIVALAGFSLAPQQQRLQRHHQLQPFQPQWQSQQKGKELEQQQFNQQRMREELGTKQQEVQQLRCCATGSGTFAGSGKAYQQLIEPIRLALKLMHRSKPSRCVVSRRQEQTALNKLSINNVSNSSKKMAVQQAVLRQQQRQQC